MTQLDLFYQDLGDQGFSTEDGKTFTKTFAPSPRPQPAVESDPIKQTEQKNLQGQEFIANLDAEIKKLQSYEAAGDTLGFGRQLASTRSMIAAKETDFRKEARAIAYSKYGVKELEDALAESKMLDQSSPEWTSIYGNADSDETAAIRSQVLAAKRTADGSVPELLGENPAYASLVTYADTIIKHAQGMFEKSFSKQQQLEIMSVAELSGYSEQARKGLAELTGMQDPVQQAMFLKAQGKNRDLVIDAISQDERGVARKALEGNPFAMQLLEKRESQIGSSTQKDREMLKQIVVDPITAGQATVEFQKVGMPGLDLFTKDMKDWKAFNSKMTQLMTGSKEDKQQAARMRIQVAEKFAEFVATKTLNSDLLAQRGKSQVPPPDWMQAASLDPKTPTISKDVAIALAKQAPTKQEQQIRLAQLQGYYQSIVDTQNKSSLFKVNPLAPDQLKVESSFLDVGLFGKPKQQAIAVPSGVGILEEQKRQREQRASDISAFFIGRQ